MRIVILAAGAAFLAAAPAAARLVTAGSGKSWGKAGVSLAQYRADAVECGQKAAATDLAGTEPAKALAVASRLIENDPSGGPGATADPAGGAAIAVDALSGAGSTAATVRMIGPDRQIAKAGTSSRRCSSAASSNGATASSG